MEKKMETTLISWGYIGVILGIMEKKMETTLISWGYIGVILGIMEKKMETTIVLLRSTARAGTIFCIHFVLQGVGLIRIVLRYRGFGICVSEITFSSFEGDHPLHSSHFLPGGQS